MDAVIGVSVTPIGVSVTICVPNGWRITVPTISVGRITVAISIGWIAVAIGWIAVAVPITVIRRG
jgi:hypothetical protein